MGCTAVLAVLAASGAGSWQHRSAGLCFRRLERLFGGGGQPAVYLLAMMQRWLYAFAVEYPNGYDELISGWAYFQG